MSSYVLSNEKAIAFFEKHPHLDFNSMNGVFVDIMEKLLQNMCDTIETNNNTELIKQLSRRLETMETSLTQQNNAVNQSIQQISNNFTSLITSHLDSMLSHMRDTIKSNNGDSEKNIMVRMNETTELLLSRVSDMVKNENARSFLVAEIEKISTKVREESERMMNSFEKTNGEAAITKINNMIVSQYRELDTSFKARIDSFFSSQSSSQGSMYTEIMNRLEKTSSAVDIVGDYFQKQIGSTNKGKHGEAKLEIILSKMFPSGIITNTSGMTACGDFIIERDNRSKVLIDTKDYDTVVPVKEVEKIIRDVEKNNCHGILVSQKSGIAQKNDFEVNVHNHKIIIFLHNAQYDNERLQLAFNMIDYLEPYLIDKNDNEVGEVISCELLVSINKEYQELASQKLNLIQSIKKSQNELVNQVQKMDLPSLTNYLDKKFANTGKAVFKCDKCNIFIGKNAKSLATHKRHCKPVVNNVIETISSENK
jgi:hypothetical protein